MATSSVQRIIDEQVRALDRLRFGPPVTHVYNPLVYARKAHLTYWRRFGNGTKEVVLLGMNPGPWGMAQNGVPFGEISAVTDWLGIRQEVDRPKNEHPKRPVLGFDCTRSEVSGRRLWQWAKRRFGSTEAFFSRFFIANYCPLSFMEASGRNRTPDKLPKAERQPLFEICDHALLQTVDLLRPGWVIGVGRFARQQAAAALADVDVAVGVITHPSPANPKANRGWAACIEKELAQQGIELG